MTDDLFSTEASQIMRTFLEEKYQIRALESTTKEILSFLKNTQFPENQSVALREWLQQTDFSKFSKIPPPLGFRGKTIENARFLIQKTAK